MGKAPYVKTFIPLQTIKAPSKKLKNKPLPDMNALYCLSPSFLIAERHGTPCVPQIISTSRLPRDRMDQILWLI